MADPLIQAGNSAAQNAGNPTATANANATALANGTAKDSQGNAITGFGGQNSTAPTVMTPAQAFNNTPTAVPTVASPDTSGAIVGGAQQTLSQLTQSITPAPTELDQKQSGLLNDIATLTGQDSGKDQALIDAQNANGVTADQAALTAANNELATKIAHYNQLQANLGGNGVAETNAVLAAQGAGLAKAAAADIGVTQAKITATHANLKLALDQAQAAVNAKYSTIEDNIKTKLAQLNVLQPLLDNQQKTQALAQQMLLQKQQQDIQDKKDQENQKNALMLQAAQNGASQGLMQQIQNAPDYTTALQLATPALAKAQTQVVEVNGHTLLIDSQTGKTLQDLGKSNSIIQAQIAHAGSTPSNITYVPGADPVADSWVTAVKNGNATMAQVPAAYKNMVAVGLNQASTIVSPAVDAQVRAIIAANPGEYGHAADAINKLIPNNPNLASQYDTQLRAVYNDKQDVGTAFNSNSYSPLAASRYSMASNRIVSNFINLPGYQLTANGLPYIQRIQAAIQTPGSISDQELLDAMTKLSTSGNAVTDAQIKIITGGSSYADQLNTLQNKLAKGGVLSDSQRKDLVKTAQDIYSAYQKGYQPIYDQVTSQLKAADIPPQFWTIPDLNALSAKQGGNNAQVGAGTVINYQGKNYLVDVQGNMTPQ